jgi:hypothetical protein
MLDVNFQRRQPECGRLAGKTELPVSDVQGYYLRNLLALGLLGRMRGRRARARAPRSCVTAR